MKTIILFVLAFIASSTSIAQKISTDKVPSEVREAFKNKFPSVISTKWEKEGETEFEVSFKENEEEYSAKFDKTGKWLETEREMENAQLPASVQATLKAEFAEFQIKEAEELETSDLGKIYEIALKSKTESYEVKFSPDGKVLNKEKMKK
jgi:hypothetical protein